MKIEGYAIQHVNSSSSDSSFTKNILTADKKDYEFQTDNKVDRQFNSKKTVNKWTEEENKKGFSKEEAQHIVNGINEFLRPKSTSLSFKLHEDTERFYVEVIDKESNKVIREIPEKELLDWYFKMTEYLGLFIDQKL